MIATLPDVRETMDSLEAAVERHDAEHVRALLVTLPRRFYGVFPDWLVTEWRGRLAIMLVHARSVTRRPQDTIGFELLLNSIDYCHVILDRMREAGSVGTMSWGEATLRCNLQYRAVLERERADRERERDTRRSQRTHSLTDLSRDLKENGIRL